MACRVKGLFVQAEFLPKFFQFQNSWLLLSSGVRPALRQPMEMPWHYHGSSCRPLSLETSIKLKFSQKQGLNSTGAYGCCFFKFAAKFSTERPRGNRIMKQLHWACTARGAQKMWERSFCLLGKAAVFPFLSVQVAAFNRVWQICLLFTIWNLGTPKFKYDIYEKIIWIHCIYEFVYEFLMWIHIHMNSNNHYMSSYMKWLH